MPLPSTARIQPPVRLLQAALNGDRDHPTVPRTPHELATEARAAVDAGARSLHLHPYDEDARQTLEARPCAAALRAVRAACPGVPISLSTSAAIEADPERRVALLAAWTELPDLVTVNQGEPGNLELCELLAARGIGIEAGLLSLPDAHARLSHRASHPRAFGCWSSRWTPAPTTPSHTPKRSSRRSLTAAYDSRRSTTATASPPGP